MRDKMDVSMADRSGAAACLGRIIRKLRGMIQNTATKNAPWYVIPRTKWFTRLAVARRSSKQLNGLKSSFPDVEEAKKKECRLLRLASFQKDLAVRRLRCADKVWSAVTSPITRSGRPPTHHRPGPFRKELPHPSRTCHNHPCVRYI